MSWCSLRVVACLLLLPRAWSQEEPAVSPATGNLEVSVDSGGGEVLLDGASVGQAPVRQWLFFAGLRFHP